MPKIVSADGVEKEIDCIGCAIQRGEISTIGENLAETDNFAIQQDYEIPIPGFLILASKKHIKGIEDLLENERKEFIDLLYRARKAMTEVLGVEYVVVIQTEDTILTSSHFHTWLFPRYEWMEEHGGSVSSIIPLMEYARQNLKTEENLAYVRESARKIKDYLATN